MDKLQPNGFLVVNPVPTTYYLLTTANCLLSDDIRFSLRPRQHRISLVVVVLEAFLLGIPVDLPVELHGDMMEQASRAGSVCFFHRRDSRLIVADCFQPVAVVILRSEEHTSELQSRENLVCR